MRRRKLTDLDEAIDANMRNIASLRHSIEANYLSDVEREALIGMIHGLIAEKEDLERQRQRLQGINKKKVEIEKKKAKERVAGRSRQPAWLKQMSINQLEAQASVIRAIPEKMRTPKMSDRLKSMNEELNSRKKRRGPYVPVYQGGAPGMGKKR